MLAFFLKNHELGIIIACAVLVVAAVVYLIVRRAVKGARHTPKKDVADDRETIESNAKSMDVLKTLCREEDGQIAEQIGKLQEKIKYLAPSQKREVISCDRKIGGKIGDVKIALTKGNSEKALNELLELSTLIAERNVKL